MQKVSRRQKGSVLPEEFARHGAFHQKKGSVPHEGSARHEAFHQHQKMKTDRHVASELPVASRQKTASGPLLEFPQILGSDRLLEFHQRQGLKRGSVRPEGFHRRQGFDRPAGSGCCCCWCLRGWTGRFLPVQYFQILQPQQSCQC